jgi:hypothetical protein
VTYPWVDDPGRGEPEPRYPWVDDPDVAAEPPPTYRPGGERRVQVLRRIDPWSALKVSLVLYLCFFAVALVVGSGLWMLGRQTGVIADIESLIEDLGLYVNGSYHFRDGYILRMAAVIGPILAVLAALATTAGVAVYNLVARLTGGIEMTVKESG